MKRPDKRQSLQDNGMLNPHPEKVSDVLFEPQGFFDPQDLLQVKYEMLRRVSHEGWSVASAAQHFGFSRVSYYKAMHAFNELGLEGLIPDKRGPKGAHKLTDTLLVVAQQLRKDEPDLTFAKLVERINKQFGVNLHPRTLQRALGPGKKKPRNSPGGVPS
jgi:transposase